MLMVIWCNVLRNLWMRQKRDVGWEFGRDIETFGASVFDTEKLHLRTPPKKCFCYKNMLQKHFF